ncbi:thioredoxin [bacterium]|nr:thioredoxin [bacterium]
MAETELTDANFNDEIATGVTFVDFFAVWCGPCKMLAPIVEELTTEYEGKAKIARLDVDQAPHVAGQYGVQSIPTMIIFKDGQEVDRMIGFQGKEGIKARLDKALV